MNPGKGTGGFSTMKRKVRNIITAKTESATPPAAVWRDKDERYDI